MAPQDRNEIPLSVVVVVVGVVVLAAPCGLKPMTKQRHTWN